MFETVTTRDGSITYRDLASGATYRSLHGAKTESRHVFLQGTRLRSLPTPWRVLELGFGTGLNFQLTCQAAQEAGVELEYWTLEPNILPRELWLTSDIWKQAEENSFFKVEQVTLRLLTTTWQQCTLPSNYFVAYYHDPFGPLHAPECWEKECCAWSAQALHHQGVLATFGASTSFRLALKEAGFAVGKLPGCGGKREMTVASKSAEAIEYARAWRRSC